MEDLTRNHGLLRLATTMKRLYVSLLLSTLIGYSLIAADNFVVGSAHASLTGMLNGPNQIIKCYLPFKEFGNTEIFDEVKANAIGRFQIGLDIEKSSIVRLIYGESTLWLLVEPGDSIVIDWMSPESKTFLISGNNASAHLFYNLFYNAVPGSKFSGLRELFKTSHGDSVEKLFNSVTEEFQAQTRWLDSLLTAGEITATYHSHLRTEIYGSLSWEVGNLVNKFYGLSQIEKHDAIMSRLFEFNPINEQLRRCGMGIGYYTTYFKQLYKWNQAGVDSSKVLIEEESYIALAPFDLQKFLWGRAIVVYLRFVPSDYDYCSIYTKYKSIYENGPFSRHLESLDLCRPDESTLKYEIIEVSPGSIESLAKEVGAKRIYLDLWATWCAPCKVEFQHYTESLLSFLDSYDIQPVFISIDANVAEAKWREEVARLNLPGVHVLASTPLLKDIKEVIYSDEPMDIPRYILIDSSGKIVDRDARRPSDSLLKSDLSSLFVK